MPPVELFDEVVSFSGLLRAWERARRGAGGSEACLAFGFHLEEELLRLQDELVANTYQPGGYRTFTVREPKPRLIAEAPFRDRVVHHAVVAVLEPLYEESFIEDSYATRKGKGTHRAVRRAQGLLRQHRWYLKSDIRSYFASIDLDILMDLLRNQVSDERLLALLERILRCDPQHPGLPIGNLTSQFLANVYLDGFDHWLFHEERVPGYVRYMDDFVLFHDDRQALKDLLPRLEAWLWEHQRLTLKAKATRLNQRRHGLSFLGTRIFAGTIRLRRENLKRSLCGLARREWESRQGWKTQDELAACAQSVLANLCAWNSLNLRRDIFKGDHLRRLQPCHTGRQLEQQRDQPAMRQSQQQQPVEHEQQQRLPSLQHP
ncbi:MAG: reverse transcriptase domain-containing protein [bacterium]|nr:reverse transcriptase domain-containing protein [bacterium]